MDVLALSAAFMFGHHFLQKEALCCVTSSAQQAVSISLSESLPLTLGWAQSPTDIPAPGVEQLGGGQVETALISLRETETGTTTPPRSSFLAFYIYL